MSNSGLHTSLSTSRTSVNLIEWQKERIVSTHQSKEKVRDANGTAHQGEKGCPVLVESDDEGLGPETPGTRPLVPRLKRVREGSCNIEQDRDLPFVGASKRVKFLQDSQAEKKNDQVATEVTPKFEWLDPSRIRDAKGRRPNNPLYDKRTLYIPPEVLRKMSASQRQYWSAKSQYMDILLFFKVVSCGMLFYYDLFCLWSILGLRNPIRAANHTL